MRLCSRCRVLGGGFTLAEVLVAIGVCVLFAVASYATNERLLVALKAQKETTAATTVLQWRMEQFRSTPFSCINGNSSICQPPSGTATDYVKNYILAVRTATDGNGNTVDPFAPLGSITEQFTINQYPAPSPSPTPTVMSWSASSGASYISQNANLSSQTLLKVDILESWVSVDSRQRQRQLSTIVGIGNVGQ
jgi:type II secretory pathway pseudopilin PulG